MSYDKWKKDIFKHLNEYRKNKLGFPEGNFRGKPYGHILNKEDSNANYIDPSFANALKKAKAKPHMYCHHLNSSQTMCVNFFEILKRDTSHKLYDEFIRIIVGDKDYVPHIQEEKYEYIEDEKEATNFDYFIKENNRNIYFEIKYTEYGFAKSCSAEGEEVTKRFVDVYKNLIDKSENLKKISETEFMLKRYQMCRNIVRATNKNIVVFLTMKSNPKTYEEIQSFKNGLINVRFIYWEDVVDQLLLFEPNNLLIKFKEKYILSC